MNEYIEVRFRRKGKPLKIKRQLPSFSIELDEPDPIARRVAIGFVAADEMTGYRMRRIQQLHGWQPGEFKLKVSAEGGSLVIRGENPQSLPEGRYRVQVSLEEAKTKPRKPAASFDEDGFCEFDVDVETDDRQVEVDLTGGDADIARVIDASAFDGLDGRSWLDDETPRPARKACLLNLLATLRVRPNASGPLLALVDRFYEIVNDRGYAQIKPELIARLEALSADPARPFYREGRPTAPIHQRLLATIPAAHQPFFSIEDLISFRAEGRPSLQIVVAKPSAGFTAAAYADVDLDLGNPLQDVAGFAVHMSELLGGRPTNHLDLCRTLSNKKAKTKAFVYYRVVSA